MPTDRGTFSGRKHAVAYTYEGCGDGSNQAQMADHLSKKPFNRLKITAARNRSIVQLLGFLWPLWE